jgi:limonene-1,2-epoxide hydrolase
MESQSSAKETVVSFLTALNDEDFKRARSFVDESLKFVGALGTRDGAEAYFKDMEQMRLKYGLKKVFSDGDDVCVLYEINFGRPPEPILTCGWYKVHNGKINSLRTIFDPRPLLQPPKQ